MDARLALVVLDGVGIGAAPDAPSYGDEGSHTLANTARAVGGFDLPNLERLGLGRLADIQGLRNDRRATAAHGVLRPRSAGKDSTTGHWEIAGVQLDRPFPTYPSGFPRELVEAFGMATGRPVIANVVGSGTDVIARFGSEHLQTGAWILYTSADSVFQIAAHEDVVPLDELYAACDTARKLLVPPHDVARVIARPFVGVPGSFRRTSNRRDISLEPPAPTLLDALEEAGVSRQGVGKVDDLFAGRGISSRHTRDNGEGIEAISEWLETASGGLLFANLVDFDTLYGHRNDPVGFYHALREVDQAIPGWLDRLSDNDLLILTADHGNDPTTASTDHSREYVPALVAGRRVRAVPFGIRETFADLGASVAEYFGIPFRGSGRSFLGEMINGGVE